MKNMMLKPTGLLLLLIFCLPAFAAERTTWYVTDGLGSPRAAVDAQGNVLWRETYTPYGERRVRADANHARPAFNGKPEDVDTGLVYMGGRWYDPATARFASIDPQGFNEGNPQSFGRYLFANNSPYRYVDPTGEIPVDTVWDAANVVYDLGKAAVGGVTGNSAMVAEGLTDAAADTAAMFIPYVPAGSTKIARMAASGDVAAAKGTRVPHAGGVIRQFTQEKDQTYYRVYSENREGSFLTAVRPRGSAWAREALALPEENTAAFVQEVLVPAGTRLERSRAIPAFGRRGGAEQFELLDRIPKGNFKDGVPLP